MRRLAPDLFDRRFGDLTEMGRARLPGVAPDWTDHNAHDPGITLMELLAWVTEAQLYSLGRMRRDERAAYAALSGIAPRGSQPAHGLVWPDWRDVRGPAATATQSAVIPADASIHIGAADTPAFRPAARLLWVAGRVARLVTRLADGSRIDHTAANARGGPAFLPFGRTAGRRDVLLLEFTCAGEDGLFPPQRDAAQGALWPIGIRADGGSGSDTAAAVGAALTATLVTPTQRVPLSVASDSSAGLLRTGVLLLDLSALRESPRRFTLELRAEQGVERAPRLLRIEPNVLPVVQSRTVPDEVHVATGGPDWTFRLDVPGLCFGPPWPPLTVALRAAGTQGRSSWQPAVLADSGPLDAVYAFDTATQRVTFGNGVNGRVPPAGATVLVTYEVSDGEQGGAAANQRWRVEGFTGWFGTNVDAVTGGAAPTGWLDERREPRRRARDDHALVSGGDIAAAALALPLLEVARAWVPAVDDQAPRTGTVTLVAMRARTAADEPAGTPETGRWLEGIRRRLAPRIPLGTRLLVTAPVYVVFAVRATVGVTPGRDPAAVRSGIEAELRRRLALTGTGARQPGVPVRQRDVVAWIRGVDGVARVMALRLVAAAGDAVDEIDVPRKGLPVCDVAASEFAMQRAERGIPS